jgi:aryl-alcohol dehydrogenase-like predicted oxidoreductase
VVAPIIGASKPGHLKDAVGAVELSLSENDAKLLEELYQPHAVAGHA